MFHLFPGTLYLFFPLFRSSRSFLTVLSSQERSQLLRDWLSQGENIDATETALVVSREQNTEMERGKELLTIKQMFDKGFSQFLGLFCFCFL